MPRPTSTRGPRLLLLLTTTLFSVSLLPSRAQAGIVNVLKPKLDDEKSGLTLQLGESLSAIGGNVDKYAFSAKLSAALKQDKHQLLLLASTRYGKALGVLNTQNAFAHLRYRWEFVPHTKLLALVQGNHDRFRLLNWRLLAGLGLEQGLYHSSWGRLDLGLVVMPEYEVLSPGAIDTQGLTWRGSAFFSQTYLLSRGLSLTNTTFWQPALKQFDDFRLLNDFSLRIPISHYFSVFTAVNILYDSRPPEGIEPLDWALSQGLSLRYQAFFEK